VILFGALAPLGPCHFFEPQAGKPDCNLQRQRRPE